jgi:sigma-B regulation protein RsbU (phosphoserine phosphatase)
MPVVPGLQIGAASWPARKVGGDYFDFLSMPDGSLGVAIGDASGHGIGAALLVAEACAFIRALALRETDPDRILTLAHRRLAEDITEDHFITLFLMRIDPRSGKALYSGAGHPGYLLDRRGNVKAVLEATGRPLGIELATAHFPSAAIVLQPGDLVLLLTDGLVEAMSPAGTRFGLQRVLQTVRSHLHRTSGQIVETLLQTVKEFSSNIQLDDCTAVIIKVDDADGVLS